MAQLKILHSIKNLVRNVVEGGLWEGTSNAKPT